MKGSIRKRKKGTVGAFVGKLIVGIVYIGILSIVFGFVTMFLWNQLMPEIFGLTTLNFWQANGLLILARLFFGFTGRNYSARKKQLKNKLTSYFEKPITEEPSNMQYNDKFWEDLGKQIFDNDSEQNRTS